VKLALVTTEGFVHYTPYLIVIEFMVASIPGFVCASLSIKVAVALCLALCSWLKSDLVIQLISPSKIIQKI
jgi:hypothetical protein